MQALRVGVFGLLAGIVFGTMARLLGASGEGALIVGIVIGLLTALVAAVFGLPEV